MIWQGNKNKVLIRTAVHCFTFLIMFFNVGTAKTDNKVDFKGKCSMFSGYESNLLRKPDIMYPDSTNPVENDGFFGGSAELETSIKINSNNKLALTINGDYAPFFNHKQATSGQFNTELDYRCNISDNITFNVLPDGGYISKLAIDETSDGDASLYKYWHYGIKSNVNIQPSKNISFKGYYQFDYNDYEDSVMASSLDNNQNEVAASIICKAGKNLSNIFSLYLSYLHKQYRTLLSYEYDSNMKARIAGTIRAYNYFTAELEYRHDFGPVEWNIAYRPRYRIDLYKDFYTYTESRIRSGINGKLPSRTDYNLSAAWRFRHYTVHTAEQPGSDPFINPDLTMKYFDLSAECEQSINKIISIFATYQLTLRRTNTGVFSFKTYRNFTDHIISGGISVKW